MESKLICPRCGRVYTAYSHTVMDQSMCPSCIHSSAYGGNANGGTYFTVSTTPHIILDDRNVLAVSHERLRDALVSARTELAMALDSVEHWGHYVPEYFQQKWHLGEDIERIETAVANMDQLLEEMSIPIEPTSIARKV